MLSLALRSLWARRTTYGLVFLELIIGFFCLTVAGAVWDSTRAVERRARQVAPLNTVDTWLMNCPRAPIEAAVARLRRDPAVADVALIYSMGALNHENGFGIDVTGVGIDASTAAALPRKVAAGRWFEPGDFGASQGTRPVVLGAKVRPELAPGSSLADPVAGDLLVIGRLMPGELFWHGNGGGPLDAIVEADSMILMPSTRFESNPRPREMARMLVFPSGAPEGAIAALARALHAEVQSVSFLTVRGIPEPGTCTHVDPDTLEAAVRAHYDANRELLYAVAAIAGVILTVGLLGYSGVALVAAERRTREFALRLAMGATTGALARQVLWEMLLLALLAAAVAIPMAAILIANVGALTAPVILFTLIIGILEAVVAALGPMMAILRRPPAYFIRGGR